MLKYFGKDLINIAFRGGPLAVKFALFLLIPAYFGNKELGVFGIVIASISIISSLVGLEIYQVTNRVFAADREKYYRIIFSYFPLYLAGYVLVTFASFFLLHYLLSLGQSIVILILIAALLEHLLQEYNRLLIATGQYQKANVFYFIKNGVWPLVFLLVLVFYKSFSISLWTIVYTQFLILLILLIINLGKLKKIRVNIDLRLVSLSSFYYLGNTLSKRAVTYLDRYIAAYYFGLEVVGLITFYTSIASALNQLVEAVTSVKYYKKFINSKNYELLIGQYQKTVNLYFAIIALPVLTVGYLFFDLLEPDYKQYIYLLLIYMVGYYILKMSSAYHYCLYASKYDLDIFRITLITVIIYISIISFASYVFGVIVFPVAVVIYSGLIYLMKKRKYQALN